MRKSLLIFFLFNKANSIFRYYNALKRKWQKKPKYICFGVDGKPCCSDSLPKVFTRDGVSSVYISTLFRQSPNLDYTV